MYKHTNRILPYPYSSSHVNVKCACQIEVFSLPLLFHDHDPVPSPGWGEWGQRDHKLLPSPQGLTQPGRVKAAQWGQHQIAQCWPDAATATRRPGQTLAEGSQYTLEHSLHNGGLRHHLQHMGATRSVAFMLKAGRATHTRLDVGGFRPNNTRHGLCTDQVQLQ